MKLRKAVMDDIELLIRLRLDYLHADGGLTPEKDPEIRRQLGEYLPEHIGRDFFAYLAEEDGNVASVVLLVVSERPANMMFHTGKIGTLLNVFTYPEFRRRGFAENIIRTIVDECKAMGVSVLELSASQEGRPLYNKLGFFVPENTYMRLNLPA